MVTINEVFPNSTIKSVIFQVRFPNLFYMESKIGDLQLAIMSEFPDSSLLIRKRVVFADLGPEVTVESLAEQAGPETATKIWHFSSPKHYRLNVQADSLDITSEYHKSYCRPEATERFRDTVEFVVSRFLQLTKIPMITRIGLRYINDCPVPDGGTEAFRSYYDSPLALDRFPLEQANEIAFKAQVKRESHNLGYVESLTKVGAGIKYTIDLDAFSLSTPANSYLTVLDQLHDLIIAEFGATINEPVVEFMRARST